MILIQLSKPVKGHSYSESKLNSLKTNKMSASYIQTPEVYEYTWVKRVIYSCINLEQLKGAYKLIDIYYRKYDNWSNCQMLRNVAHSHKLKLI